MAHRDDVDNNNSKENNDNEDDDLFAVFNTPAPLSGSNASSSMEVTASSTDQTAGEALPVTLPRAWGVSTGGGSVSVMEALRCTTHATAAPASIMSVMHASSQGHTATAGVHPGEKSKKILIREPNSGISVSHPTKSCEQIPLVFAQHPFFTFAEACRTVAAVNVTQSSSLSMTVIGVVIRKTDPKQKNGKTPYGIIGLWNMQGPFPTEKDELSVLFCSSAFNTHYTKLGHGVVLAVSGFQRMEARKGPPHFTSNNNNVAAGGGTTAEVGDSNKSSSQLLKVITSEQVRVLGYASELGTCQGIQRRSGERCNGIVKSTVSNFCGRHLTDLRQEARGTVSKTPLPLQRTPSSASVSRTSAVSSVRMNPLGLARLNPAVAVVSRTALQTLARDQPGFLTVKGSCGLPTTSPATSDVTSAGDAYAGVTAGRALPVTDVSRNVSRILGRTPAELGVTARGRAVLAAAAHQEKEQESQRLLRFAMQPKESGTKRAREDITTATQEAAIVRAQYGPIASDRDTAPFAPLRSAGFDEVLKRRGNFRERCVTRREDGTASAIVSAVERHIQTNSILKRVASQAKEHAQEGNCSGDVPVQSQASLLGMVADSLRSANDDLRGIDEKQRFEERMERRLVQDKALEALSEVTEQNLKALYCLQCERWYPRRNERCRILQHVLEARVTTRRFIECEHCGYKTSVLGDVRPSKLIPRCPRCSADVVWRPSNAAPELSKSRDDVPLPP